ncbi:MAG: 30S ribosomal protein S20 [Oscillospiraceae bacterium]|nr:30S ribosomal protein S20 [Oscillospiraceae bacterium]
MPNIKSAEKRVELGKVNNARNKANKSELKTVLKKFDEAVQEGSREKAESAYKVAVKAVDKAAGKGLIHKNNAAHKKSSLDAKLAEVK